MVSEWISVRQLTRCCGWVALGLVLLTTAAHGAGRQTLNFNPDWKFLKADAPGAQNPAFDDRSWQMVSTPHTFNDVDTFDNWSLLGHRGEQNQWSGRTWYRKEFALPKSAQGKKVFIEFEGARQIAEIYLNGQLLGVSKTGFTPFGFDLTPHLRFNETNVLAVMCDNRFMKDPIAPEPNTGPRGKGEAGGPTLGELSAHVNAQIPETIAELQADQIPWNNPHWHPAHGGIYRNVFLHIADPLHIPLPLYSFLQTAGPYVYSSSVSESSAKVHFEVPVSNDRENPATFEVVVQVLDHGGRSLLSLKQPGTLERGAKGEFKLVGVIDKPLLWAPGFPYLYRIVCSINVDGRAVDSCEIPFGIRTVRWDVTNGFFINGNRVKLRGWGQKPTDEWPGLGAAQPDWLHHYTLNLMKEAGANFVRWGHCAGGPASIAAADRLGLIVDQPGVDGESDTRGGAWALRAEAFRDTLVYFRNNPSILIWEGGNQKVSTEHARELRALMDKFDPHGGRVYAHRRADPKTAEFMDIGIGTEGGREIATLPVVEGEYNREESPRRIWDDASPPHFGYAEGKGQTYHLTSEQFAVNQVAQFVRKLGATDHSGGANWIFSDSTSGGRVACEVARASGEVDGSRLPKEAFYVCKAMFRADPQVHIIGHWTYPAGTRKTVYVASNGDAVELFLNGKSLGRGSCSDRFLFTFSDVQWSSGEIKAVAYREGKVIASQTKRTTGPAVALRLTPVAGPGGLRADGSDVALVDVEAVDANGERCPTFQQRVDFELNGPATWRGGYNSGKTNSINHPFLDLECGVNRVAIRAGRETGKISLRATAPGLKPAELNLRSGTLRAEGGIAFDLPAMPAGKLPKQRIAEVFPFDMTRRDATNKAVATPAGRFTRSFSYSGPTTSVHVEQDARAGKRVYVDHEFTMPELPAPLVGADWVQAAAADGVYSADDLMEISVAADTVISVAYDDRLPRPPWLVNQFAPVNLKVRINGHAKSLYQRHVTRAESLTLGSNVENSTIRNASMYVVFIAPSGKGQMLQASERSVQR